MGYDNSQKPRTYYNKKTNLLEREYYHHTLQDVEEPNLFREFFNYSEVPKVIFNRRVVPMEMPDNIWITDTTFRDGQQSTAPFTVEQIVHIF
ncbi:MAG TPA: 2-isopropylmalate synthase, partial [Clostridia bacterium]